MELRLLFRRAANLPGRLRQCVVVRLRLYEKAIMALGVRSVFPLTRTPQVSAQAFLARVQYRLIATSYMHVQQQTGDPHGYKVLKQRCLVMSNLQSYLRKNWK